MARRRRNPRWVQILSVALHGSAFAAVVGISTGHVPAPIAVMVAEMVQTPPPQAPPPPPLPTEVPLPTPAAPRQRRAPSPPPEAPPAEPQEAPSDSSAEASLEPAYGVALDGALGSGSGIGVPIGDPGGVRRERSERIAPRVLAPTAAAEPRRSSGCSEDEVPPRQRRLRMNYTDEAIAARIEGRVRISVSLDESGRVADASVLTPLGFGLDESALAAVRSASFDPATRCGRPVATSFVIGVRFQL